MTKLKIFNIKSYSQCEIETDKHQMIFTCTFPKGDSFEFSVDVNRSQLRVDFQCLYRNEIDQGVVLYRGEPNSHVHIFWLDLITEYHRRKNGNADNIREQVLKEFDLDWEEN
jgi:hypothetical protein